MNFKYKTTKEFLTKPRTKKQHANMLRVLYGKKKDRGHIKKTYFQLIKQEKKIQNLLYQHIVEKYPQLNSFMNVIGGFYF